MRYTDRSAGKLRKQFTSFAIKFCLNGYPRKETPAPALDEGSVSSWRGLFKGKEPGNEAEAEHNLRQWQLPE